MQNVQEKVLTYIGILFQLIRSECSDRNQEVTKDKQVKVPQCPFHLLHQLERNREEVGREVRKAEHFVVNVLKARLPRKSPEVSEWFT